MPSLVPQQTELAGGKLAPDALQRRADSGERCLGGRTDPDGDDGGGRRLTVGREELSICRYSGRGVDEVLDDANDLTLEKRRADLAIDYARPKLLASRADRRRQPPCKRLVDDGID
jgi:hypothetical protein